MQVLNRHFYLMNLKQDNSGHVQSGIRPVIVVQNNKGNANSNTTIVVPVTKSKKKNFLPTHVTIDKEHNCGVTGQILCEQIITINQYVLIKHLGKLPKSLNSKLDNALKTNFSLD